MRHSTGALAVGHLHECEPCGPVPANLIYRADMAHEAGDSGARYCTLHTAHCTLQQTAESGVCLGLAETESTRGRGLRLPFAKQEVRARTLGPSDYRLLQRAEGKRPATDRCHSKCLTGVTSVAPVSACMLFHGMARFPETHGNMISDRRL